MKRRSFFGAAAAFGAASAQTTSSKRKAIVEVTRIQMRNSKDQQMRRTRDFVSKTVAPALRRAGSGPVGIFSNQIGADSPYMLVVASYPSLAAMEQIQGKLGKDSELREAAMEYYGMEGLGFQRVEKSLLRGFESVPDIAVPRTDENRPSRIFELRIYESDSFATLARKVGMFNDGEVALFRKVNMLPVFFGEALYGPKMPNLTYMLAFDNMAAREEAWGNFVNHPEWKKMRVLPGLTDAEVVSNISNSILRPLPGSDIR